MLSGQEASRFWKFIVTPVLHSFFGDGFELLLLHNKTLQLQRHEQPVFYYAHGFCRLGIQEGTSNSGLPYSVWNLIREDSKAEGEDQSPLKTGLVIWCSEYIPKCTDLSKGSYIPPLGGEVASKCQRHQKTKHVEMGHVVVIFGNHNLLQHVEPWVAFLLDQPSSFPEYGNIDWSR